ncbi:MAG: hypothetical protein EA374_03685 [Acholeplasmatales bacterium]|nr:MAG: hypothetical protein EA374_03685 [Acholeplasmatales bacterium]
MKNKLRALARHDTPDVRMRVKASPVYAAHIERAQAMQDIKSPARFTKPLLVRFTVMAAILATLLIGLFAWPAAPTTTVHLAINPSLSMTLSSRQIILSVDALNDDAETLLSSIESLEGLTFEQGFEAFILGAEAQGYLIPGQSGLLYDVTGNRPKHVEEQLKQIEATVRAILETRMPDLDMMRGMAGRPTSIELDVMAHYGLSIMHARLIGTILRQHEDLEMDDLITLSIRELRELLGDDAQQGPKHPFDGDDFPNRPDVPKRPDTPGPPDLPGHSG